MGRQGRRSWRRDRRMLASGGCAAEKGRRGRVPARCALFALWGASNRRRREETFFASHRCSGARNRASMGVAMPWGAIDPGASRNAVGIAVIDRDRFGRFGPIYLREIRPEPGRPLDLRNVLVPYAREVHELGCETWATDGFAQHDVHHASLDAGIRSVQCTTDLREEWRHLLAICARGQHALGPSRLVADELLEELAEQLRTIEEVFANG